MNDAVVGEGVLSSRITQPKLGAEARFGDIFFFLVTYQNTKRIVTARACRLCLRVKFVGNIFLYCSEDRARHRNALWAFFKISGISLTL